MGGLRDFSGASLAQSSRHRLGFEEFVLKQPHRLQQMTSRVHHIGRKSETIISTPWEGAPHALAVAVVIWFTSRTLQQGCFISLQGAQKHSIF